jgi:hypothetical protein
MSTTTVAQEPQQFTITISTGAADPLSVLLATEHHAAGIPAA